VQQASYKEGVAIMPARSALTSAGHCPRGGIPLVEGGKLIGAIGCSGGTGSQDEAACKVGAATVK